MPKLILAIVCVACGFVTVGVLVGLYLCAWVMRVGIGCVRVYDTQICLPRKEVGKLRSKNPFKQSIYKSMRLSEKVLRNDVCQFMVVLKTHFQTNVLTKEIV